jgi:hypothetical protein
LESIHPFLTQLDFRNTPDLGGALLEVKIIPYTSGSKFEPLLQPGTEIALEGVMTATTRDQGSSVPEEPSDCLLHDMINMLLCQG